MRKYKKFLSLALIFLLMFQVASVFAEATTGAKIVVEDITIYAGNSFTVDVKAEGLVDVATLDLTLFYDNSLFTLQNVTKSELLNGTTSSINKSVPGAVSLSMATITGINGNGILLKLHFTMNSNAVNTNSKIDIAIGEAYNNSVLPVSILGESGNVEVLKTTQVLDKFELSTEISQSAVSYNKTTNVIVKNKNFCSFASADFTFEYDPAFFSVVSVEVSDELKSKGVSSPNTNISGLIKVSYASSTTVSASELFTVKLKAIKETESPLSTEIRVASKNVCDLNLNKYQSNEITSTLNIVGERATLFIDSNRFDVNKSAKSTLKLSAGSGVAAANFYIDYDVTKIKPVTVTVNSNPTTEGMVVINPEFNEGRIKLSYLNEAGATSQVELIDVTWEVLSGESHILLKPTYSDVVDVKYNDLDLDCITSNNCVYTVGTIDTANHPHSLVTSCKQCGKYFSSNNFVGSCLKCNYDSSVLENNTVIVDSYKGNATTVSVPTAIDGKTVSKIGSNCFKNKTNITTVTVPQTITEIGSSAFSGCTALTKTTIYKSVKTIGENAFSNCNNLVIYCEENSAIHNYAKENNIDVELIGVKSLTNSEVDCDKNVILVEDDFHTSIETFIALSNDATVTKTPSATYEEKAFYGTGSKITVYDNDVLLGEYTLVVKGDVNGDSVCDALDCMLVELARHSNNNFSLEGAYLSAGDLAENGSITIEDFEAVVNKAIA